MKKKLVVLGAQESGVGAAILGKKNNWDVFVSDKGIIKEKEILIDYNIKWEELNHSIEEILEADEIVKSPGISDDTYEITQANLAGIPIISEVEFASRYTNAEIIAITGSNGKTTTTMLTGHILRSAGLDVLVAGNIGVGFSRSIAERDYEYIVLELSSFQLDGIQDFRPNIAVLLNITPDHLDRYNNNFELYKNSKLRITENQLNNDSLIYNIDDQNIITSLDTKASKIPISISQKLEHDQSACYQNKNIIINLNQTNMTIQELALQGKHNVYNSMAAAVASKVLEVNDSVIRQSLLDFQNVEHRLEYVLTVNGIDFINDSKATNINAVWYALESMNKPTVWIVGGVDKGNDYSQLLSVVKESVKAIICIGENTRYIHKFFKSEVNQISDVESMNEAVIMAYEFANRGDVVLLSPACASFDMFKNFEHRGIEFKKSVRKL